MAITAETRNDIIELVVTAYNAAPGTTLLTELVAIVDGGGTLADVATALTTSARWTSLYPSFQTAEEFAAEWLGNLVPEASAEALAEGVSVAVGLLNGGSTFAALVMEAQSFLSAAAEDDASFGTSAANFNNKVEVATNHTVTLEKDGTEDELANVLSTVTSDDATVTAANESEAATATGGETYTLTSKIDNITGTTSDDTINGIFSATASEESYNLTDTIDGGAGTDTLNVNFILSGDLARTGQSANNVEVVNIKSTDGATASNTATFTISGIVGETQVWVRDNTVIGSNDDTITVNSITDGATLGLASNDSDLDVNFTTTGAATSADTVALAVAGGSTGDVVINDAAGDGYATINLTTSGAAGSIGTLKSTDLTTLNILGDQKFTSLGLDSDITTLDASANTAGVTVNATAGTKLKATGTAEADTLALTVSSSVTEGMSITGFETISFAATANATVDMDLISGASTYALSSSTGLNAATLTMQDLGAAPTIVYAGGGKSTSTVTANGVTPQLKDASGTSDSITFSVSNLGVSAGTGDATVGAWTTTGIETVTISATDFDDLTIGGAGATFTGAKTVNVSGSADINFNGLSGTSIETFNAGSSTGDLTLGALDNAAASSTVTTGSGKDSVTNSEVATTKTQTINTGAGNDTLTLDTNDGDATGNELGTVDADLGDGDDSLVVAAVQTGTDDQDITIKVDGGAGTDSVTITDTGGAATITFASFDNFEEIILNNANNVTTNLTLPTGYNDTVEVTNVSAGTDTFVFTAASGGSLSLSKWTFLGTAPTITINGVAGNETLTGSSAADIIDTGAGSDTVVITDTTDVEDVVKIGATGSSTATVTGFDVGGAGTDDDLELDISDIEGTTNVTDLVDAAGTSIAAGALTLLGSPAKGADIGAAANEIITLTGDYADTDTLETAIETGGSLDLVFGALSAGDAILVAYDNGTDTYIATVTTTAGIADGAKAAAADLKIANYVKLTGIADATTLVAGDLDNIVA